MSDDLIKHQEEISVTVKPCPNCRKSQWTNTIMSLGYERLECHECGLVLFGFSGLFTEEPAVAAWNIMSTRIEELETQLATARADALREFKETLSVRRSQEWRNRKSSGPRPDTGEKQ